MRNFKKFAAMASAVTLAACAVAPVAMNFSAVAAENVSLTMNSPTLPVGASIQEEVKAYKVFDIELVGTGEAQTLNVTGWGDGVNYSALINAMNWDASITPQDAVNLINAEGFDTEAFAKAVMNNSSSTVVTGTYENNKVTFTEIDNGYYAVSCTVKGSDDTYTSQSLGMLTVVGGTATQVGTGTAKVGLPTVEKKVKENVKNVEGKPINDSATTEKWNDIADYNIGDAVPFKLYGTLPSNLDKYDSYYYMFSDNLDNKFDRPTVLTITIDNDGTENDFVYTASFSSDAWTVADSGGSIISNVTVLNETDNNGFKLTFNDIKTNQNADSSTLVTVEYSAKLNSNAVVGTSGQDNAVKLTYSNNPNNAGEGDTGETPEDKVRVYTYALEIDKTFFNAAGGDITAEEIKNQTYKDVKFTLTKSGETSAMKFKKVDESDTENYGKYDYIVDSNGTITELELTKTGTSPDEKLVIRIKGLDDGIYTLKETAGPNGFNLAPEQTIEINATTVNNQEWGGTEDALTEFKYQVDSSEKTGTVSDAKAQAEVQNKRFYTPGTGGIGTTIFYIGGGAMVAVAGVFLITKKRMGKKEN